MIINKGDENPKFEEELAKDVLEIINVFQQDYTDQEARRIRSL